MAGSTGPPKATVHEAIAAVIHDLPGIGKDTSSPEGYLYRGIEAVTREVQPLLARHGVVITGESEVTSVVASPAMKDGWQDVYLKARWTITGPDGSQLHAQTNGVGRDRSDKGVNKAQTQAFKYLLLQLLCIADTADDTDGVSYENDREEGRRGGQPSRQTSRQRTRSSASRMTVAQAKGKLLTAIREASPQLTEDEAKAEAARLWKEGGLEGRAEITPEELAGLVPALTQPPQGDTQTSAGTPDSSAASQDKGADQLDTEEAIASIRAKGKRDIVPLLQQYGLPTSGGLQAMQDRLIHHLKLDEAPFAPEPPAAPEPPETEAPGDVEKPGDAFELTCACGHPFWRSPAGGESHHEDQSLDADHRPEECF